jgi:hypothetical protein
MQHIRNASFEMGVSIGQHGAVNGEHLQGWHNSGVDPCTSFCIFFLPNQYHLGFTSYLQNMNGNNSHFRREQ